MKKLNSIEEDTSSLSSLNSDAKPKINKNKDR